MTHEQVVLCMSADRGNAALLDSDWATLGQLVAPGVRVDVVESRCRYQREIFAEPSKRHATPESS